ncbi:MAG: tetratricopeptide repeat protein [Nitrospira sp.]
MKTVPAHTGNKKTLARSSLGTLFTITLLAAVAMVLLPCSVQAQEADAEVLVAEGILAYDANRYDEAISLFSKAVALDPSHARAFYYLGLCHLARGQAERAIAPLTTLHTLRPTDLEATYQLGIAHFAARQYDKAAPLLEEVFRQEPERDNLGFYVGFLRYQQKDYDGAAAALSVNTSSDPDLRQLTFFYRGLALGVLGLSDQARAELASAQRVQPNSPITGVSVRIQEALTATKRVADTQRLHLQLAVGGYYDDNVAVNPRKSSDPVAELLRSRNTQSPGLMTLARGDYAWYRNGPIESTVTYSYYQTVNTNSGVGRFNIQDHLGGLSGVYRGTIGSMPYEIGGQYSYDYMFLDFRGFLSRHTVTLPATLVPPAVTLPVFGRMDNLTTLLYRYQRKEFYAEPGNNDIRFAPESRDAFNNMVGFLHAFRFQQDKYILRLGYQHDTEAASGSSFAYSGNRLQFGGQATLPWYDLSVRFDYEVHWRAYQHAQVIFLDDAGQLSPRRDTEQDIFIQVAKALPRNLTLALQYQGILNSSNIPVYAYSKNVFTTLLTWTY